MFGYDVYIQFMFYELKKKLFFTIGVSHHP